MSHFTSSNWISCALSLSLSALLLGGCAVPANESAEEEGATNEAKEELISCSDASCTGLNPYNTPCGNQSVQESAGTIYDQYGNRLGQTTLFYSPVCHTIWGYAGFSGSHGAFQICATDITNVTQPPQCVSYPASTPGGASNMQYLRVGDYGYASTTVQSPTLGSGSSSKFQRTF
jgi:hypothetical protein